MSRKGRKWESFLKDCISVSYNFIKSEKIRHQMDILIELLEKESKKVIKRKKKVGSEYKEFIVRWKEGYKNVVGLEYKKSISPEQISIIISLTNKLKESKFTVKEYTNWLYNDFFKDPSNKNMLPPNIKASCSDFFVHKFFVNNKNVKNAREIKEKKDQRKEISIEKARNIYKETKNKDILNYIDQLKSGVLDVVTFDSLISKKSKELK